VTSLFKVKSETPESITPVTMKKVENKNRYFKTLFVINIPINA